MKDVIDGVIKEWGDKLYDGKVLDIKSKNTGSLRDFPKTNSKSTMVSVAGARKILEGHWLLINCRKLW